jgi:type II secretory pathway component GspD/PulD (secretin)
MMVFLFSCPVLSGQSFGKTTVIQVKYRWASEALPIVKHFLSPDGIVTMDQRTNSLIISDRDDVIANIQNFLKTFDVPTKQVRIRLRLNEGESSLNREVTAKGGVSGDNWRVVIKDSDKEGIEVWIKDDKIEKKQSHEYVVHTTSGNTAHVKTGAEVPYRQRWRDYCSRYGDCPETLMFQTVDTGMEITPVIVGDHANIEIIPRISNVDPGDSRGIIYFSEAATRIRVPLGQWVTIGGADRQSNEVLREILGGGRAVENSSLSMSIMVETY